MIDFYYIDLYFDASSTPVRKAVSACTEALAQCGAHFDRVLMARPDTRQSISLDEHVALTPADIPAVAEAFVQDALQCEQNFVAFPPLGRIMFSFPFRMDEHLLDEVHEEEEDMHSDSEMVGLTFNYTKTREGAVIKASLSFWEEYILKLGDPAVQADNMRDMVKVIRLAWGKGGAFFGAMNTEMHLNTDSALSLLRQGKVPEGNEFVMVGGELLDKLNFAEVKARGYGFGDLPGGGVIIQMADKWEGRSAV